MKLFNQEIVYRPVPSPCYEVEVCESWLTDMAARGLFVEKLGRTLARFRRGTPRTVQYRLTAARLKARWLEGVPSFPSQEEQALYGEYGWYFVCAQQEFFLYACEEANVLELHTDPTVQALSLKLARRSAWGNLFCLLAVLAVQFFLNGHGRLVRLLVEFPLLSCCLYLYFFGSLLLASRDLYHILRLSHRLHRGYPPDHHKNWRPAARVHRLCQGVTLCAFVLLLLGAFGVLVSSGSNRAITNYQGPLPFAPLQDLADGTPHWDEGPQSTLERRHSLLAPTIIDYQESGIVLQDGAVVLDTPLVIHYYDTRFPWLAKLLVGDLHEGQSLLADTPQPLPDLPGMDAAYGYADKNSVFRQLILVQGRRVMSVLWTDTDGRLDFEQLAPRFAEKFSASA